MVKRSEYFGLQDLNIAVSAGSSSQRTGFDTTEGSKSWLKDYSASSCVVEVDSFFFFS